MVDAGDAAKGFKYTSGAADYQYDLNGNMTQDNHKGFTFAYNYLNLPQTMTQGANVITLTYTADGEKLTKALSGGGATKSYVSGIEYSGTNLEAIYFSEGRCTPNGASAFYYDYTIKDHLGNARENFRASGGTAITHLEDMHYYPFGMLMEGMGTNTPTNDYAYNGKELNEDLGLNLSDYGARWYDAALGRWWSVDLMAEKFPFSSSYSYVINNPLALIDPDGMQWINPYFEQIDKELRNGNLNLERVEELAALGNKTQGLINEIKEKDPELYDYVENLKFSTEEPDGDKIVSRSHDVQVRVYLSDTQKGSAGQLGDTKYGFSADQSINFYGKDVQVPLSQQKEAGTRISGDIPMISGKVGFNIVLYNNFNNVTANTLANEAGDVMAFMEYNREVKASFIRKNLGYSEKFSTKYSNAVENAHIMLAKGSHTSNIFPLKATGQSFITQNGKKIKH
jgi:RHS repeat-associated protein